MFKKVSILVQGNVFAHIFTLIALVVLPSIYDPKSFGLLSIFLGISNILFIIFSGRYERALLLPKSERKAIDLYVFSILLSFFMAILFFILIILFHSNLNFFFDKSFLKFYIYLVPFYALILALSEIAIYYLNRYEKYKKMAISKVVFTSSSLFASIIFGLIAGEMLGRLVALIYVMRMNLKKLLSIRYFPKIIQLKKVAIEYKEFPLKSLTGATLGVISNSIPLLIIGKLFSLQVAGYYLLAYKLLSLPAALLAKSISHVFYKQAILENEAKTLNYFIMKTTIVLFIFSAVFLIFFYLFIDFIVESLFSNKWHEVIIIAKIFAPLFTINFIFTCQSSILMIKNKLNYELLFNACMFIVLVSIYILTFVFNWTYKTTFSLSTIGLSIIYVINIIYIFKISKET